MQKNDPLGKACLAYLKGVKGLEITVKSNHCEDDIIPVDYLFRTFDEMPLLEQTALHLCKGKILDVGAGGGCHSKWLSDKKFDTIAIDTSKGVVEALHFQGLNALQTDFFTYSTTSKYDTLLVLMNGTGICGVISRFPDFLNKCKKLLVIDGQILIDSSDIIYLFDDEDEILRNAKDKYYGQVKYQMLFDDDCSEWFNWLYLSFDKLKEMCRENEMNCELIIEGNHYDYLARITKFP